MYLYEETILSVVGLLVHQHALPKLRKIRHNIQFLVEIAQPQLLFFHKYLYNRIMYINTYKCGQIIIKISFVGEIS